MGDREQLAADLHMGVDIAARELVDATTARDAAERWREKKWQAFCEALRKLSALAATEDPLPRQGKGTEG